MRPFAALALAAATLALSSCSLFGPRTMTQNGFEMLVNSDAAPASCRAVARISARADCACWDQMSYNRVRGRAHDSLREQALSRFPGSDALALSTVDMFLNNAVAHGTVYDCFADTASL